MLCWLLSVASCPRDHGKSLCLCDSSRDGSHQCQQLVKHQNLWFCGLMAPSALGIVCIVFSPHPNLLHFSKAVINCHAEKKDGCIGILFQTKAIVARAIICCSELSTALLFGFCQCRPVGTSRLLLL